MNSIISWWPFEIQQIREYLLKSPPMFEEMLRIRQGIDEIL